MAKQEKAERPKISRRHEGPPVTPQSDPAVTEKSKELKGKMDRVIEEVEAILDEVKRSGLTAETYVQRGGQ